MREDGLTEGVHGGGQTWRVYAAPKGGSTHRAEGGGAISDCSLNHTVINYKKVKNKPDKVLLMSIVTMNKEVCSLSAKYAPPPASVDDVML